MIRSMLRNRWVNRLGCVALGAALYAGVQAGIDRWKEVELGAALEGRWTLDVAHADPAVRQVDVEYRPDGTFLVWQTRRDESVRIIEHGRWWVSGRRLMQEYASADGRPVPTGAQGPPEEKLVARADQMLVLVWPAGFQYQFKRAAS